MISSLVTRRTYQIAALQSYGPNLIRLLESALEEAQTTASHLRLQSFRLTVGDAAPESSDLLGLSSAFIAPNGRNPRALPLQLSRHSSENFAGWFSSFHSYIRSIAQCMILYCDEVTTK